jgi:hypothetical protein
MKFAVPQTAGLSAHWRGTGSFVTSFWLRWALPWVLLSLLVDGLAWIHLRGDWLWATSVALLLLWPLLLLVVVWGGVGAWRAAQPFIQLGGLPLWAYLGRAGVVLGGVFSLATLVLHAAPQMPGWLMLAVGHEPLGRLQAQSSPDGRRLQLKGAVGMGDAARVQQWLVAAPAAQLIELDSPGGRLHEARQIAAVLRERKLATRVTGRCEDACMLVFMAGAARQAMPAAQLGFRRAAVGSLNPAFRIAARADVAAAYQQAGLPAPLVERALGGSRSTTWVLDQHDLLASGLIGVPGRPLDVELPPGTDAPIFEYADALRSNPVWQALERRFPGTVAAAALDMQQAHRAGADAETVQITAQAVVRPLWARLPSQVEAPLREKLVRLLIDELRSLEDADPQRCARLLAGDVTVRRQLPLALGLREAEWLTDALAEPPAAATAPGSPGVELEVIRRVLGRGAPAVLSSLRAPGRQARMSCASLTAMLEEVVKLAIPERRLALRLIAEPS